MIIRDPNALTPVEEHDGVFYKRDDLFMPFGPGGLNGGKCRQTLALIRDNVDPIRQAHNSTLITTSSIYSTSGAILAAYGELLNFRVILAVGGTKPVKLPGHPMMRLAAHYGADIRIVCGTGMSGPVHKRVLDICQNEGSFNAIFSDNADENSRAILDSLSLQVQNIPDELDVLIVAVGTGLHLLAIMQGLEKYGKKVKRIIGCHVGPDRRKKIDGYLSPLEWQNPDYEMTPLNLNSAYGKPCIVHLPNGDPLDELYEAKAHVWMQENIDTTKLKTLLWLVGRRPSAAEVDALIDQVPRAQAAQAEINI